MHEITNFMFKWVKTEGLGRTVESSSMTKKKAAIDTLSVSEFSLTKKIKTCNSPDWTGLPGDVVLDIADRLMSHDIEDCVRFGAVCTSWRTVLLQNKKHQLCSLCSPLLLLIAPPLEPDEEEVPDYRRQTAVYSPGKNKVYRRLRLHVPHHRICCGSSFGWLINLDAAEYRLHLQNPFLNKIIHLPRIYGFVYQCCKSCDAQILPFQFGLFYGKLSRHEHIIRKAALSSDPLSSSGEFVVVGIMSTAGCLAFFKSGTEDWTSIGGNWEKDAPKGFRDVIFYHKAKQFYVSKFRGEVFAINFVGENGVPQLTQAAGALPIFAYDYTHLVEDLSSGDLYQVSMITSSKLEGHHVHCPFLIFKLDAIEKKWIRIHDLGGKIMFFGSNGSFLRSAPNCPGCLPNCIYFFTNTVKKQCYQLPDEGIYSLKDGTVQPLYTTTVQSPSCELPTTVWLEPNLL